jgi:hypothetical protein
VDLKTHLGFIKPTKGFQQISEIAPHAVQVLREHKTVHNEQPINTTRNHGTSRIFLAQNHRLWAQLHKAQNTSDNLWEDFEANGQRGKKNLHSLVHMMRKILSLESQRLIAEIRNTNIITTNNLASVFKNQS